MNRLREIRNERNMTQAQVADALGINRSTYANYECERREVDHLTLVKLADLFGVTIDCILGHDGKKPTVEDDGLRAWAIKRVSALSDPALARVHDFLSGLEAGQEIGAAPAADHDSDAG